MTWRSTRVPFTSLFQTPPLSPKVSPSLDFGEHRLVLPFITSHKWNYTIYIFLSLAFFVQHIFEVESSIYFWFVPSHCCSVDVHLSSFQSGAFTDSTVRNILTHVFWCTYTCISVGYICRTESAGSKNIHIVYFGRYYQIGFQYGCVKYEYFKLFPSWFNARFVNCWTWNKRHLKAATMFCFHYIGRCLMHSETSVNICQVKLSFPQILINEERWSFYFHFIFSSTIFLTL